MRNTLIIFCALTFAATSLGQRKTPSSHEELLSHPKNTLRRSSASVTPRFSTATTLFPVIKVNQFASTEPQNEPSVRINPKNKENIVAAYRDFRLGGTEPAVRNVGIAATTDGGATWLEQLAAYSDHNRFTDPAVAVDTAGNFYVVTLDYQEPPGDLNSSTLSVRKSTDGGLTWFSAVATEAQGFHDKEMITVDDVPGSPYVNSVYISYNGGGQQFTRSTDGGFGFEPRVDITDVGGWTTPITGINGEVYVAGVSFDAFRVVDLVISNDGGQTFGTVDTISADHPPFDVSIDGTISGIAEPVVAVDKSQSPRRGTLYASWQSDFYGDADMFCRRSTDGGTSWGPIIRVNTDSLSNGRDQFHHWMTVDDSGWVDLVFLDRRNDPANIFCDAYLAQSRDGGMSFKNYRLTPQNFDPRLYPSYSARLGDYMGIDARQGRIVPIWVDTHLGNEDVYISLIDSIATGEGSIEGIVFNDVNGNSLQDPGEAGLSNWTILLYHDGEATMTATDSLGHYAFGLLSPGAYAVKELVQADWLRLSPSGIDGAHAVTISSNETASGRNFANLHNNGTFTSVPIDEEWNLLSVPRAAADPRASTLFSSASSDPFTYEGGYTRLQPPHDSLRPGRGFWLKFDEVQSQAVFGDSVDTLTVPVSTGWNLVGGPTVPVTVSTIQEQPPGILIGNFYHYSAGGYVPRTVLTPGEGYWIKSTQPGALLMSPSLASPGPASVAAQAPPAVNSVSFIDGAGRSRTLYFGDREDISDPSRDELPPVFSGMRFDVRFATQSISAILPAPANGHDPLPIEIHAATSLPLRIAWNVRDEHRIYTLTDGKGLVLASSDRPAAAVQLGNGEAGTTLLFLKEGSDSGPREAPGAFALRQNFPNPFNPGTTLSYSLPHDGVVVLSVYNIAGEEVAELEHGFRTAGPHAVAWDASAFPSGVYYSRLLMGSFRETKKMLLLR